MPLTPEDKAKGREEERRKPKRSMNLASLTQARVAMAGAINELRSMVRINEQGLPVPSSEILENPAVMSAMVSRCRAIVTSCYELGDVIQAVRLERISAKHEEEAEKVIREAVPNLPATQLEPEARQ